MHLYTLFLLLLLPFLLTQTNAQRPLNTSICDYWTPSILGSNTPSTQALLLTLIVNTFVIGNYTTPNTGITVPGFASPAIYNGTQITLIEYFDASLNSTNQGGDTGTTKLFLDDGGPVPVAGNMSSNGHTGSAQ
jgi:hypothetical protein